MSTLAIILGLLGWLILAAIVLAIFIPDSITVRRQERDL